MCGIGGFSLSEGSKVNPRKLAHALLTELERRGNQASGYAWQSNRSEGHYKKDTAGSQLSTKNMARDTHTAILHTRLATHGSIREMANNHPVLSPDRNISLVHNGVIYNHDLVRAEIPHTLPEVDTSVIPAILQEFGYERFDMLDGDAAVAWLDKTNKGVLQVARVSHSPLFVAQLIDGSFVFASTEIILESALKALRLRWDFKIQVEERTLLTVRRGRLDALETLPDLNPKYEEKLSASSYGKYRSMTSGNAYPNTIGYRFNNHSYYPEYSAYDDVYSGLPNSDYGYPAHFDEDFERWLDAYVQVDGKYYDHVGTYVGTYETLMEDYEDYRYREYWATKDGMKYTYNPDEDYSDFNYL